MSDMDPNNCPLRRGVIADPLGSSSDGFRCYHTDGHCLPCADCEGRVELNKQRILYDSGEY